MWLQLKLRLPFVFALVLGFALAVGVAPLNSSTPNANAHTHAQLHHTHTHAHTPTKIHDKTPQLDDTTICLHAHRCCASFDLASTTLVPMHKFDLVLCQPTAQAPTEEVPLPPPRG